MDNHRIDERQTSAVEYTPCDAARFLRVIWLYSLLAIFVFGSVFVVERPDAIVIGSLSITAAIIATASFCACASFWTRDRAINEERARTVAADPYNVEWLGKFQNACVFTWAFCWGVGLSGLVLGWLAISFQVFLPFGAVALVLLTKHRPMDWPQWESLVNAGATQKGRVRAEAQSELAAGR